MTDGRQALHSLSVPWTYLLPMASLDHHLAACPRSLTLIHKPKERIPEHLLVLSQGDRYSLEQDSSYVL